MASAISFQGLSTNLQTDQLVNAIMQQESLPLTRLQQRQALNTQRSSIIRGISSNLQAFTASLNSLNSTAFEARSVSSSDANGTYATATASGAAVGSYDLVVSQVATKARLDNASFAVADAATTKVFDDSGSASATFAIQGSDGVVKTFTLSGASNNLNGMRDAINAAGAGVSASVVNIGSGANPYRLILTAKDTGTGTTAGVMTLAEVTSGAPLNALGIAAGTLDNPTTPTTITGGTQSAGAQVAVDAQFSLNGVAMTRKTNVVADATSGVTFTLKKGDATGTVTTFTVGVDKGAITSAANDVVAKFNAAYTAYKSAAGKGGALEGDQAIRSLLERARSAFMAVPSGFAVGDAYSSAPALGFKTNQDGTLGLDATVLSSALDQNFTQVRNVIAGAYSATSTLVNAITAPGSGNFAQTLSSIDQQNLNLTAQINSMQARLDRRRESLQNEFARLESVVGQLQAAGQSLAGLK